MTGAERARVHEALVRAERGTTARIAVRIVPDAALDAFERAKVEFEKNGMHAHAHRNAALILVAPNAKSFAVIGDRALHEIVAEAFWRDTVAIMQPYFASGEVANGLIAGIDRLGEAFSRNFPAT